MPKEENNSSGSESEISAISSKFDPVKALYSPKVKVPVRNAPLYDNVQQFESAQSGVEVIPVGYSQLVAKREAEKEKAKLAIEKELEEKNKRRFNELQGPSVAPARQRVSRNLLTRFAQLEGPLAALRDCVESRIRVKVVTRHANGIRGELHGCLCAFDKQWNLAMTDVLEVWRRKKRSKRKIPPMMGEPVAAGSARARAPVPAVTETPVGGGVLECTRHLPQLLVRGEHVVLVNIVER